MENIYKTTEIIGSSTESIEDAVNKAIDRAAASLRKMRWFEVGEIRGQIEENRVHYWQVTIKVGFTLE